MTLTRMLERMPTPATFAVLLTALLLCYVAERFMSEAVNAYRQGGRAEAAVRITGGVMIFAFMFVLAEYAAEVM